MGTMNLSQVMDKSIDILREKIKTIALFSLAFWGISIGACLLWFFGLTFLMGSLIIKGIEEDTVFIIGFIVIMITVLTLNGSYNVGIVEICSEKIYKKNVDTSQAIKISFKKLFKVLTTRLIILIIAIPIGFLGYGVFRVLINTIEDVLLPFKTGRWTTLLGIVLVILLLLLLLGLVVAFLTVFAFCTQAITIENAGVFNAISRSWTLVKYNFGKVFVGIIMFYICVFVFQSSIESLVYLVISIFYLIMKFFGVTANYVTVITYIITQVQLPKILLYLLVITPISTIMMTMLYFNQRTEHEGFDMRLRLREIQKDNERKQASDFTTFNRNFSKGF